MLKSPRKCISSAADAAFFNMEGKLVYRLHMKAMWPINRAYKKRVLFFRLISSQIDSVSEDSRSFRHLYLM